MIAILTRDKRFYDYLAGIFAEEKLPLCDKAEAKLFVVDLDSERIPAGAKATVTISSDIFEKSDLTRPFLQEELVSLCRECLFGQDEPLPKRAEKSPDGLVFENGAVLYCGERIPLTPAEERLLRLLSARQGEVVSLADCEVVCRVRTAKGNSVSVTVASLRKKLDYHFEKRMILSIRGEGYRLSL